MEKVLCSILAAIIVLTASVNIRAAARGQSTSSLLVEEALNLIPIGNRKDPEYFTQWRKWQNGGVTAHRLHAVFRKMVHGFIGFTFIPEAKDAFRVLTDVVLG